MTTALLFAGCTNEPEPKEPDATSKPTPTATVPSMPAEAAAKPPEGAASFVTYYIKVFNYAAKTGDTSQMLKLSSNCEACSKYAKEFEGIHKRGDSVSKDLWKSSSSEVLLNKGSIEVIASVQTEEDGRLTQRNFGFTLPSLPPYNVAEIFEAVTE
ncbi:MAG: DUF6318 family protein [Actinomycetota bacterium]|nr:DUF6318 family protein [Actinomycetota bacterium]